jgi:hypothetical protein
VIIDNNFQKKEHKWESSWRTPKLLDRLKCESKVKTTKG